MLVSVSPSRTTCRFTGLAARFFRAPTSAACVASPTTPSAGRPAFRWNFRTSCSVTGPEVAVQALGRQAAHGEQELEDRHVVSDHPALEESLPEQRPAVAAERRPRALAGDAVGLEPGLSLELPDRLLRHRPRDPVDRSGVLAVAIQSDLEAGDLVVHLRRGGAGRDGSGGHDGEQDAQTTHGSSDYAVSGRSPAFSTSRLPVILAGMATLGELMHDTYVTVAPEDTIGEAAQKMVEAGRGAAAVSDFGRLIGILTDRDVMRSVAARTHSSEERVRGWMTPDPITAAPETTAEEAAKIMLDHDFRHLPVVDGERAIGIVSIRAVLRDATAK